MSDPDSPLSFPSDARLLNQLFTDLFDEQLSAKVAAIPWEPTDSEPVFLLRYKSDNNQLVVLALLQFNIAAAVGALLTRHPLSLVNEVIEAQSFTPELLDNLKETMNIAASIFNKDYYLHVLFQDLKLTKLADLEPEFRAIIDNPVARLAIQLSADNDYGQGCINYYQVNLQ